MNAPSKWRGMELKMKYSCVVISVKDIKESRKFYEDLFGLEIYQDYGRNISFSCGISLQEDFDWLVSLPKEKILKDSNNIELCFEEDDFDGFLKKLKQFPNIKYLGDVIEHSWGQRVVRFYDLDSHIIEVGEAIKMVVKRFLSSGLSMEETSKKMDVSISDLETLLKNQVMRIGAKPLNDYLIREIKKSEYPILEDFLYEAIFQRDANNLLPRDVIKQPELNVFIDNFGQSDDNCLVCVCDEKIVGAVWTRILSGEVKGFGNIDNETPEFAISLYKDYRDKGIGTSLMKSMLDLLKRKGYKKTSLAVQKDNYAFKMYARVGFEIIEELDEEYLMVCHLV